MARRPGVRVAGGRHGGRALKVAGGARPTEGRVREALFSIWQEELEGCQFLDLYAGSGVVGLEAAGRGALEVLAVERDPRCLKALEQNRKLLDERGLEVRRLDLPLGLQTLHREGRSFDLMFADPPYGMGYYETLLQEMGLLLRSDGIIALEHAQRTVLPAEVAGLVRVEVRRYGDSALSFYRQLPG
ncbi:MAG: 16S rRNA (guanine(966)-N(2))-methyltransferase RsmD [Deltaproteobacteria bacterium]|nr:16S rRNA (guanine(966)-N(2))-methyltransferase RsmD [Deltaproteobacteria bacterium]